MNDLKLERAFAPVPPVVHFRVQNTLKEVREMDGKKARPIAAVLVVAALIVLMMGVALAAFGGNVLSYLIGDSTPTEQQKQSVQPVGVRYEGTWGSVTVTDCLYDGLRLSCGLDIQANVPVYVAEADVYSEKAGDMSMMFASPLENFSANPITGEKGQPDRQSDGFLAELSDALQKVESAQLPVTLEMTLLTPTNGVREVEVAPHQRDPAYQAWVEQADQLNAEGYTVVVAYKDGDEYAGYEMYYPSRYYADIEAQTQAYMEMTRIDEAIHYLNLKPLDTVTLAFEADGSLAAKNVRDITPAFTQNDGRYAWTFERVLLSPLGTYIRAAVVPQPPYTMKELQELMPFLSFYDGLKGNPLRFQDGEYMTGAGVETLADGTQALVYDYPMPPLETLPDEFIWLVPFNHQTAEESPLWEHAVYIPVGEM